MKTYNVPGHFHFLTFSCFQRMPLLSNELWRSWLAQAVRAECDRSAIALWAYVFMPEHVHLLVFPRRVRHDLSAFRQTVKAELSNKVKRSLAEQRSPLLDRLTVRERPGKSCFRFWQEGPGFDKNLWSNAKAWDKARYCHQNPVVRGLVGRPEAWRWSSYRWLELGSRQDEPLRVDDWDERLLDECPADRAYINRQWEIFGTETGRE